jgi:hypothetical protein
MKKIIALFLAVVIANNAMAHGSHGSSGDGSGLSAGLEFGLHIHNDDETEVVPNTTLSLSYSEGFFDDKLEFDIGLSYIFSLKKRYFELDHEYGHSANKDFFQQVLCLNAGLTYSIDVTYFSTLSFILENDTDFFLSPRIDGENNIEGVLTPGIKWNWGLNFGDVYTRFDLPLQYVSYFKDEEFGIGSDISIGWESNFGLGLGLIGHFLLSPKPESYFDGVDAAISYAFSVKNLTFYLNCEFEGIGSEEGFGICPSIGFRYNF